ncbi:COG complex component [Macrolepiota fuliginosa MF-IS2]|uniref:Conserved oligomeric Golgi complex subunit 2 n=1 Tax=Macrolepiota fuliginosa MF-IS2 TaxID=1400762 RepID=A0A9P5XHG0_9AGAR|nr:COG complex component [Macrolepiota fuliginosa MF-IS2]
MTTFEQSNRNYFSTEDPYQLDRLAEELASREDRQSQSSRPDGVNTQSTDLPDYGPLSHHNTLLTGPDFNVEEFLLSRARASLPELRTELRDYLATLKEELVQLINNDYEAFISLSTDLRSEGSRLKRMRGPLGDLRSRVLESRKELEVIQDSIQEKLDRRTSLREEKALLHLLLKFSESVTRLESLLLITSPERNDGFVGVGPSGAPAQDDAHEEKGRSNRAKHIARVAAEYMQLLYHVSKAREEKCAFVDELQWRVDRIQSTLSSDLDHLFATLLTSMRDDKPDGHLSEIERAKLLTDLKECLRTYDALGLWRDAEDVLRREVVRPFLRKTVYYNALGTPQSPIVPKTPFRAGPLELVPPTGFPLRTPYTPFTAFAPKQDSSSSTTHLAAPPHTTLPEDGDNPLAHVYNQILRFIARDMKDIMELAEHASSKKATKPASNVLEEQEDTSDGFQIMGYVVWEEVASAIINDIGDNVFSAGRPSDLRKNYDTTQNFLRYLELFAPSAQAVQIMRGHELYREFERRWQLPVYFQLRWKEIVVDVEEAFNELRIEPTIVKDKLTFSLSQTAALWHAITTCWSSEVLIPELSHRFWRLTLQLLSRYAAWLNPVYTAIGESSSASRSASVNTPTETSSAETIAIDDALLRQYAAMIADVTLLESKIANLWQQEISIILPPEVLESTSGQEGQTPQDALKHVLSKSTSVVQPAASQIIAILTKRCCEALLPVKSIPSQFRAMSNKRLPTEPSYFVQTIFRPLRAFFAIGSSDGPGRALKDAYSSDYSGEVFNNVVQRYISYLVAMKKTEESLRRLKKGQKSTFSLFGNAKVDDGRDEERIRTQMLLDVEAFGKEAQSLGIDLTSNEHYDSLKGTVLTSGQDDA